jgi:arsenate reductase-like glutaredoxin family protein
MIRLFWERGSSSCNLIRLWLSENDIIFTKAEVVKTELLILLVGW